MRLIKLTSIENRDIAISVNEIMSIEEGDYLDWRKYGFEGRPTRILMKDTKYSVREDFETVCKLIEGANDYERATEQVEHDTLYEPTYNSEDGSM